jgi:PrtD family type I secretion system ABC transporter
MLFRGIFFWLGARLLVRASARIDRLLSDRVLAAVIERSASRLSDTGSQLVRDLDTARQFYTGRGAMALMDAPWVGLFTGVLLLIDLTVGLVAIGCMIILTVLAVANAMATRRAMKEASRAAVQSYQFVEANLRSAEAVLPMGMLGGIVRRWHAARDRAMASQQQASSRSDLFNAASSSLRVVAQALILSVAVVQVVMAEAPIGFILVAVVLFNFAMRPIRNIVGAWDSYRQAREALGRLNVLLARPPSEVSSLRLPRPRGHLTCQNAVWLPPSAERAVLKGITLNVEAGSSLGIFGPTGSGKTSLVRLIVGLIKPSSGHVRLDGAEVTSWDRQDLGRYLGYLPQDVCVLSGTVADNIGRFGLFDDGEIVEAAQRAGIHNAILALPRGYDTPVGEGGHPLPGGQRQLIALARAIVGSPSLVVLDEPNANLDGPGENALLACIQALREAGTTLIMVSHRPNLVQGLDQLALLRDGTIVAAGPTPNIMQRIGRPTVIERASSEAAG